MMQDLSKEYWNNRYITNDFSWDIGEVSLPLKTYFQQLHDKNLTILIPGAGNAYEAEFLFLNEFKNVHILDYAIAPLENIKKRLPFFPPKQLFQIDFFEHKGQYDLIVEQTFFCAINKNLRERYVDHAYSLLKPGGKLIGLLFNDVLNEDKPPFGGNILDYEKLFFPTFQKKIFEPCYNSIKPRDGRELFVILQKNS